MSRKRKLTPEQQAHVAALDGLPDEAILAIHDRTHAIMDERGKKVAWRARMAMGQAARDGASLEEQRDVFNRAMTNKGPEA